MPGAGPELPQRFVSSSAEATERAGARVASRLSGGAVVLISGELGAGKTTFVRGALRALGVREPVTSPTFVVGHLYDGSHGSLATSTSTARRF
jgi:tRNA threonylcarbamoyladenosine biosynthesis protein TsaE